MPVNPLLCSDSAVSPVSFHRLPGTEPLMLFDHTDMHSRCGRSSNTSGSEPTMFDSSSTRLTSCLPSDEHGVVPPALHAHGSLRKGWQSHVAFPVLCHLGPPVLS